MLNTSSRSWTTVSSRWWPPRHLCQRRRPRHFHPPLAVHLSRSSFLRWLRCRRRCCHLGRGRRPRRRSHPKALHRPRTLHPPSQPYGPFLSCLPFRPRLPSRLLLPFPPCRPSSRGCHSRPWPNRVRCPSPHRGWRQLPHREWRRLQPRRPSAGRWRRCRRCAVPRQSRRSKRSRQVRHLSPASYCRGIG